jgi:hypothetical protein
MYGLDEYIFVWFQVGDWNIIIYSQLSSMISGIYKLSMFTSSATKLFKKYVFIIYKMVDIVNV